MVDSVIFRQSELERRTADAVQAELRRRLDGDQAREEIAASLGLVPVGLDALMNRYWTLEEAFRVARAVGIDFGDKLAESERPRV
jgi:hypothetical protein